MLVAASALRERDSGAGPRSDTTRLLFVVDRVENSEESANAVRASVLVAVRTSDLVAVCSSDLIAPLSPFRLL